MEDLKEINERLTNLPQEICAKKKTYELLKIHLDEEKGIILLNLDRAKYTNADLREAFVYSNQDIIELRKSYVISEAEYYEAVNFFSAVQERARNIRAEIKATHDGV